MGQAFRNLELVVMPVQVMFPNPQKLSKETKRVQDLQDTLRPLCYNQMNFAVFNQGSSIQLDKLPQQVGPRDPWRILVQLIGKFVSLRFCQSLVQVCQKLHSIVLNAKESMLDIQFCVFIVTIGNHLYWDTVLPITWITIIQKEEKMLIYRYKYITIGSIYPMQMFMLGNYQNMNLTDVYSQIWYR